MTRETNTALNTAAGGSGDAAKTWVDARSRSRRSTSTQRGRQARTRSRSPSSRTPATAPSSALQGATVTATLTDSNGASHAAAAGTCITGNDRLERPVHDHRQQLDRRARSRSTPRRRVTVSSQTITRSTGDGKSGDSADAVKTFVDAYITISPATAINPLNATHTFTVQVFTNDGSGAGYVGANGVTVNFTLLAGHVGDFTGARLRHLPRAARPASARSRPSRRSSDRHDAGLRHGRRSAASR